MQVVVNGNTETFSEASLTVTELLNVSGVESPDLVSVQLNGEFVNRTNYSSTQLKDQDEVDFLYFMGGGQA